MQSVPVSGVSHRARVSGEQLSTERFGLDLVPLTRSSTILYFLATVLSGLLGEYPLVQSPFAPTVSVIMPTFNDTPWLSEALLSVQDQSFAGFECIVVDDGSTDDTSAVVREFSNRDSRFKYIRREHEGSPGTARNLGVDHAKGQILVFHDSDDIALPDRLARIVQMFNSKPDIGVVYHDYLVFDHNNPSDESRYFKARYDTPAGLIFKELYAVNLHITASASVLTKWYSHFGGQKSRSEIALGEDFEFFLRISPKVPCAYIDAPLLRVRRRKPNHLSGDLPRSIESRLRALDDFENLYPELKSELSAIRSTTRGHFLFSLGRAHLWRGNDSNACRAFQKAFNTTPSFRVFAYLGASTLGIGRFLRLLRTVRYGICPPDSKLKLY